MFIASFSSVVCVCVTIASQELCQRSQIHPARVYRDDVQCARVIADLHVLPVDRAGTLK